jgi:hypothetical protein
MYNNNKKQKKKRESKKEEEEKNLERITSQKEKIRAIDFSAKARG